MTKLKLISELALESSFLLHVRIKVFQGLVKSVTLMQKSRRKSMVKSNNYLKLSMPTFKRASLRNG
jgi:hypothetical protein